MNLPLFQWILHQPENSTDNKLTKTDKGHKNLQMLQDFSQVSLKKSISKHIEKIVNVTESHNEYECQFKKTMKIKNILVNPLTTIKPEIIKTKKVWI